MSSLDALWSLAAKEARHMPGRARRAYTVARQTAVYGWAAPALRETIYVDPRHIRALVTPKLEAHLVRKTGHQRGVVVGGDWDIELAEYRDFRTQLVYRSCHAHWVDGVPWEETEIVRMDLDLLAKGEPCPFADVGELMHRYHRLDGIFAEVTERGALSRRYEDLVQISVARDHGLLWGPDGRHRVAIALIAGLPQIPARIGFIHPQALAYFQTLRTPRPATRHWFVLPGARGDEPRHLPPAVDRRSPSSDAREADTADAA